MNTIRNIESATLISIGALCAAAVLSIATQSAHAVGNHAAVAAVPTVTITAKRMTAAEKTALRAAIDNGHATL